MIGSACVCVVCVCTCVVCSAELEKCYNFTQLAVELNETEDGVAPSDSRLRPDQRLMEQGLWDDANTCKVLLEEKQRAVRRQREWQMEEAATQGLNQVTRSNIHKHPLMFTNITQTFLDQFLGRLQT